MSTAVLFIGWDHPQPGKDDEAYSYVTGQGIQYLQKHEGTYFDRMELIALTPHAGDMNGCFVLFGQRAKLDELRRTDEFEAFAMTLDTLFTGLAVVPGVNWEGIQAVMERRKKAA